jgi:23S rRNA (guanosine2251-2'-O)-methyltransferase
MAKIIVGFHAVEARLRHHAQTISEVYVDQARHDKRMQHFLEKLAAANIAPHLVASERLNSLSQGARHQGILAFATPLKLAQHIDDILDREASPFLLVLDEVTDPHNLGACLRVADAAGVHAVIAPRDRSVGINATVSKVASGAAETLPYITVTNLARTLRELKDAAVTVIGTAGEASENIYQVKIPQSVAWVLGAEGEGMRRLTREACDQLVHIPMRGSVSSLNVSVATGVCLFETVRQHQIL